MFTVIRGKLHPEVIYFIVAAQIVFFFNRFDGDENKWCKANLVIFCRMSEQSLVFLIPTTAKTRETSQLPSLKGPWRSSPAHLRSPGVQDLLGLIRAQRMTPDWRREMMSAVFMETPARLVPRVQSEKRNVPLYLSLSRETLMTPTFSRSLTPS